MGGTHGRVVGVRVAITQQVLNYPPDGRCGGRQCVCEVGTRQGVGGIKGGICARTGSRSCVGCDPVARWPFSLIIKWLGSALLVMIFFSHLPDLSVKPNRMTGMRMS